MKSIRFSSFLHSSNIVYSGFTVSIAVFFLIGVCFSPVYSQENESELTGPMFNQNTTSQSPPPSTLDDKFPKMFVKITSHKNADKVDSGTVTILGLSSDSGSRDCIVEMDWNNQKPSWIVTPTGPGGSSDFSTWKFTYDRNTHEIEPGTNELTSKLTCINPGPLTKWYSVTLVGLPYPIPRPFPLP
jgi:hypothetical protein